MDGTVDDSTAVTAAIAKLTPAMARTIRDVRRALRDRFPTAFEPIYDNYNFFVIGFSATERPSDCVLSLVADAKGVGISFYRGAAIADPGGLLLVSGTQPSPMPKAGTTKTILRSISEKQRTRRVTATAKS